MTEWRTCAEFPDYEISEDGALRRLTKGANGRWKAGREKVSYLDRGGYLCVKMPGNKTRKVHRLVAMAFLGQPPSRYHDAAHNDGVRIHNHWSNIRWATRKENMADTVVHGTATRGERNGRGRLLADDIAAIRAACADGMSQSMVAKRYGVSASHISGIVHGKFWKDVAIVVEEKSNAA